MDINKVKGRSPELLVDWNGNAVQCFPLGGETDKITAPSSFVTKSTLIRIANDTTTTAFVKRSDSTTNDTGIPILPNTANMFSVLLGEIYNVTGSNIHVTFIRDRDA